MTSPHYAGKPVYFPFVEGQFSAGDCHACGEQCCRHTRALVLGPRQRHLLDDLGGPEAILARDGSLLHVDTSDGCPSLRADGLCALHARGGLRNKPALCAMFPYVALSDHGDFFSLAPNIAYVCPLSMEPSVGAPQPRFQDIADDLQYFFPDGCAPTAPAPLHRTEPIDRQQEAELVRVAHAMRGRGDFVDALCEVRGPEMRGLLQTHRAEVRRSVPSLPAGGGVAFHRKALPLVGILRTWLFGQPRDVVDRATDLSLRLLHRRMRRDVIDRNEGELQRMARALQRDLPRALRLAQLGAPDVRTPAT